VRMSSLLAPTLREAPAEAEVASHRLLLRAGLMRRLAAGIYSYLPLGLRAIAKVEAIAREEMDRQGAQEVRLPLVQPEELWIESGRSAKFGEELWRLRDRHGRPFVLAPTHEEVMTEIARQEISSWRQMPLILYHVTNKYRDEPRPRFGLMRAREFVMKDAYSFDRDRAGLAAAYAKMREAYARYCTRCGLDWRMVEADPGTIGGSETVEFVALSPGEVGEAELVFCDACGYAADVEKAEGIPAAPADLAPGSAAAAAFAGSAPVRLHTPGVRTIDDLCAFAGLPPSRTAKILFYWAEWEAAPRQLVAVLLRGDRQLNEIKLRNHLAALRVSMADRAEILAATGAPVGSAGPVGLHGARVLSDLEVAGGEGYAIGANQEDWHLLGAKAGRDFDPGAAADLRKVGAGDPCPRCGGALAAARGIEVGHMFALGAVYSQAMGALYRDDQGGSHPIEMGCYGIGITRTLAAVVERHHDADGIVWPWSVAPLHVAVVPVAAGEDGTREVAERLYAELLAAGVEAVLDDRDERPGVKFKDADLLGWPLRVTVGRDLRQGKLELRQRDGGRTELVAVEDAAAAIRRQVAEGLGRTDAGSAVGGGSGDGSGAPDRVPTREAQRASGPSTDRRATGTVI
jgi:prolyl-tRNA synthetase